MMNELVFLRMKTFNGEDYVVINHIRKSRFTVLKRDVKGNFHVESQYIFTDDSDCD